MIDLQWLHNHPTEVFECISTLKAENEALLAQVEVLLDFAQGIADGKSADVSLYGVMAFSWFSQAEHILNKTPVQCLAEIKAQAVDALKFPTMLRKMWSGSEVQAWIKEEAKLIRQAARSGK